MFIRTRRLFLRPGWAEDAPEIARVIAHEPAVRMLARAPLPSGDAEAHAFLESSQDPRWPRLLVTVPAERGRIVGACGIHRGESGDAEIGYWITPECRGNGYAREALGGLLGAARWLRHDRLVARLAPDNPAPRNALRAIGFRPTGRTARCREHGRGAEVASIEYALDLVPARGAQPDWTRPAAYASAMDAAA